ncbi:MAG: CBS domain-containing protein [Euryarchaeota archaeon]|nr:CBS domain-containing protein [Euryarchaeota archaeon]
MELTPIQKEILTALISMYHQKREAVKGEEIAKIIDRNPGTIRNQMQALKTLGLVAGVPGPKGGYKATGRAYQALTIDVMEKEAIVPVRRNGELVKDLSVDTISFTTPRHPKLCSGAFRIIGDLRAFQSGDKIEVGPTPVNKLVVRGEVTGRDDTENTLICSISEMISLPKRPVIDYVEADLVSIPAESTIQEAARLLVEKDLWSAPVMEGGRVIGIASLKDVGRAVAQGQGSAKVREFAEREVVSIDGGQPLREAVKLMNKHDVGSLLITQNGTPRGHVTRTRLLNELVVY